LAIFSWKKGAGAEGKGGDNGAGGATTLGDFTPQPEKARTWFEHARKAADATNFEGALAYYANGIKLDPETMSAHEAMWEVALKYANRGGQPASSKEIKHIEENHAISKFAAAEFAWFKDVTNLSLAVKALEAAIKAGQREWGKWIAPQVLRVAQTQKKVSKGQIVLLKELFKQVEAWEEAIRALAKAKELDPTDNSLDHEYKDLSAQRAMTAGGYERAAGQEGGFRSFVKDSERQRQLAESESIVTSQSAEERNLQRAKEAYEKAPNVPDVLNLYAQLVKKQGTPEAEELAYEIYMKGYQATGEYRFRTQAGDIRLEQARRSADALQSKGASPEELAAARRRVADLEAEEFEDRVAKYPTNRELKMRLGEIEFVRGNLDNAMGQLQSAKDEPKLRVPAGHMLGRCFAAEGWHLEAIGEYKEALQNVDATERDRELAIRYDLMLSLIEEARKDRSMEMAREALEICSGIARKDITYRDIRAKRREIEELQKSLQGHREP
jgi:tetratricopeptide (TPR) repeat protein